MDYLTLKWIHILSAILLFGTGLGSAFYKFFSDRSGEAAAMAVTNRLVVTADWMITTPTILIQPLTGFWMIHLLDYPSLPLWVWLSLALYLIAGACWLPVCRSACVICCGAGTWQYASAAGPSRPRAAT